MEALTFLWNVGSGFQMCIGESFKTSKIKKMSSRLPLAFYAGLRIAGIPGPWHYKG